ncbi:peptidylprolyl isomerase [Marivivens sp. JLT3646]|uniref:peptidylprolyl isomerase n=1 Tax=Marivivens sp. JLT3646 TaxID=1920883 RepID=UPI000801A133|nr:peptidylprolyl isomerase [Marivivens sp. JLT3646]APO85647.1 peptidase [Marivivens sp. JLT3646]OBR35577.1 peptidase [Donghicola sp. JL3646]
MGTALFPDLIVNGETVPHAVVAAEVQNHDAPAGKPGIAWRKAARAVAIRTLLLQEARARGLIAEPLEVAPDKFETEEEALIRGLLDTEVEVAPISEAAIRAEFDRDPDRFRAPPLWEVSHILIACDPADKTAVGKAKLHAEDLTAKVLKSPESFARLAEDNSDCGSRNNGGALGQMGQGDTVPEFEAVLRHLREGETTKAPVQSRFGWHIIRMDAVAAGKVLPFETVRQKITDAIEKAAWSSQARALVQVLAQKATISGADLSSTIDAS